MSFSIFADEPEDSVGSEIEEEKQDKHWNILIIDDEQDIHTVTTMVLRGFSLYERNLNFIHAHSGQEAFEILSERNISCCPSVVGTEKGLLFTANC